MIVTTNRKISGWKYYNHAAIPTCAPHETPDLTPIKDGSIWKMDGKPLLARYTTDWDCGYDTGWWYLIKEAPFDLATLSSNSRKHIRVSLKKTRVEKIDPTKYVNELYECSHQAFLKYQLACNESSRESFAIACQNADKNGIEFWAGFDVTTEKLIGWMNVRMHETWCEIVSAKFDPRFLKLLVSDALYATVLDYYLNKELLRYVSSGSRSINHVTNTQAYKEQHFGYRKVYCRLNILYSKKVQMVVSILFHFRKIVDFIGKFNKKVHLISSVLKMEEIQRSCRKI